jgi:hypothetical protein
MAKDLTKLFNKFAGKEISVQEIEADFFDVDPNDKTVQAMENLAKANGLTLRVIFPGSRVTKDMRMDRVNVHVEKEVDGKYRIGNRFKIG